MRLQLQILLLLVSLGLVPHSAFAQNGISQKNTMTATNLRKEMFARFSAASHASGLRSADIYAISFAPALPQMAVGMLVEKDTGKFGQVWITPILGAQATMVAEEPNTLIDEVSWSPDGAKLAYIARETVPTALDRFATRLTIVDIKTRRIILVAAPSVSRPTWSPDGKSVFFWQAMHDAKQLVNPDNFVTWLALRYDLLANRRFQVSTTAFTWRGSFSPDGKKLAGLGKESFFVENLADHHQEKIALRGIPGDCQWSSDSQWVNIELVDGGSGAGYHNTLLHIATGKQIDIDSIAETSLKLPAGIGRQIHGVCWMPDKANRLLLRYLKVSPKEISNPTPYFEQAWLLYDLDTGQVQPLPGFDPRFRSADTGYVPHMQISADGHYMLFAPEQLFALE